MAKSTVAKALASLQYKFQQKIVEVGTLKKQLSEARAATALEVAYTVEVGRLRAINSALSEDLRTTEQALAVAEVAATVNAASYNRLSAHGRDVDGVLTGLRSDLSNWKSLAAVLFVVGVAVGTLSALAYVAQTTPL